MLSSFTALQIPTFVHQPFLHHHLCIESLDSSGCQVTENCKAVIVAGHWPGLKSILQQSTLEQYQAELFNCFLTIINFVGHCSQKNMV